MVVVTCPEYVPDKYLVSIPVLAAVLTGLVISGASAFPAPCVPDVELEISLRRLNLLEGFESSLGSSSASYKTNSDASGIDKSTGTVCDLISFKPFGDLIGRNRQ